MGLLLENCFCVLNLRLFNCLESIWIGPVAFFLFKVFRFLQIFGQSAFWIPYPTSGWTRSVFYIFNHIICWCSSFVPPSYQLAFLHYFLTHPGFAQKGYSSDLEGRSLTFSVPEDSLRWFEQCLRELLLPVQQKWFLTMPTVLLQLPPLLIWPQPTTGIDEPSILDPLSQSWVLPGDHLISSPLCSPLWSF